MSNVEITAEKNLETANVPLQEINIAQNYLGKLFCWIIIWEIVFLLFIWIINPYGVSPIYINLSRVNVYKPKRLDIDRLIKPYEVWKYKPKTVLMGTSRIHQSIDPSIFDGTDYAPAYNAAIPASTLAENATHIEQFLKLDPYIKDIFIELFFYNFTTNQNHPLQENWTEFFNNLVSLQISSDAFLAALHTLHSNQTDMIVPAHVTKLGYRVHNSDFNPINAFNEMLFIHTVLSWDRIAKMSLQQSAIDSLDRIVNIVHNHKVHLHMLLTPNYPWDDYRLMSLGYWPLLEKWLRKMSTYSDVISFSQYNTYLEETPVYNPPMKWWNDPTHFSLKMGHAMMLSLLGHPDKGTPNNLMRPLNKQTVESIIAERRAGALHWAAMHPDFVENFEEAKKISETVSGKLNFQALIVNDHSYPLRLGVGEIVTTSKQGNSLIASGWVVDEVAKKQVTQIIATIGSSVVSQSYPTAKREDIIHALGKSFISSGFNISIPLTEPCKHDPIRVFGIMRDGHAVQLTSYDPLIESMPMTSFGLVKKNKLNIDNKSYPIVNRLAGAIEHITKTHNGYSVNGWVADIKSKNPVSSIIAAVDSKIISKSIPTIDRDDIKKIVSKINPIGFTMNIPITNEVDSSHIHIYALMSDGTAALLNETFKAVN